MEWIAFKDRLPQKDGAYLCAEGNDDIYIAYRFPTLDGPKAYFRGMEDDQPKYPTHWMPLPKPPTE